MPNNIIIRIERYKQNSQEYISGVFLFKTVSALSKVLVYKQDEDGYQRQPNRTHYLKIKNYILKNLETFKFPTSIILGTDKAKIDTLIKKDACGEYIEIDMNFNEKVFRIVDGQHRIEGIREAAKEKPSLNDLLLNAIILVSPLGHKSVELEAFIDINSTAKRISTDLATLARFDYEIKEKRISEPNPIKHIATKTAFYLKEDDPLSVWSSAVKFDIHSEISLGIVGVTLFRESIEPIVSVYLETKFIDRGNKNESELITYYDDVARQIAVDINEVWNNIIRKKWSECFSESIAKNEVGELKTIFYSNEYYIQKTLGVKVLNILYSEILKQTGITEQSKSTFQDLIQNSKVMSRDWRKGGPFSGLSSESGFAGIRKMIKNEIEKPNY
jgi:DGQHR domain-containing protein